MTISGMGISHIPVPVINFLSSSIQSHELVSSLEVTTGSKQDGTLSCWNLTIARGIFLVHLTVLSNLIGGSSVSCSQEQVSPDMMVFGLRVSEIPPFVGKKLSILTALSTMCIIKSFEIH
jgi:hypothetical protein